MIVRDEAKVIARAIKSAKDYIDYYVIVDTGSVDDTISIIKSEMDKYGIDGEVHQETWVNFGVARTQMMEHAQNSKMCDWVLIIDGDEEFAVSDSNFKDSLEPGVSYLISKKHGAMDNYVLHLVDVSRNTWSWGGVVHNFINHETGPEGKKSALDTVWIIYHAGEGAKSHGMTSEQKYLRDARMLEEELKKNPNDTRSMFYLGQSYKDAGLKYYQQSYDAYKKRVAMGGWTEEQYYAQYQCGNLARWLNHTVEEITNDYLAAGQFSKRRAEHYEGLVSFLNNKKLYDKAYEYAKIGSKLPMPPTQSGSPILFLIREVYQWKMLDVLAVAAYWTGHYAESKVACEEILRRADAGDFDLPENQMKRIQENLQYAVDKEKEQVDLVESKKL